MKKFFGKMFLSFFSQTSQVFETYTSKYRMFTLYFSKTRSFWLFFVPGSITCLLTPASLSYGDAPITGTLTFSKPGECYSNNTTVEYDSIKESLAEKINFEIKVSDGNLYGQCAIFYAAGEPAHFEVEVATDDSCSECVSSTGQTVGAEGSIPQLSLYVTSSSAEEIPLTLKAFPIVLKWNSQQGQYCLSCYNYPVDIKYRIYDLFYSFDEEFALSDGLEKEVDFLNAIHQGDMARYKCTLKGGEKINVKATITDYGNISEDKWKKPMITISKISYSTNGKISKVSSLGMGYGSVEFDGYGAGDYYITVYASTYDGYPEYSYNSECGQISGIVPVKITITSNALVVNTTGDEADADLTDGVCDSDLSTDDEQCTLRAAIQEANKREGEDTITFESGVSAINPGKSLPDITETVTIDASSNSSSVELNGSNAGKNADGLSITSGNLTVKNLTVSGFSGNGVKSDGDGDVALENVMITGNGHYGILADGAVYINSDPSNKNVLSPTSTTTSVISANGGTDDGGGVWSSSGPLHAAYVEIKDNKGPGVASKKNILLEAFTISGNKGPGVQSLSGGVSVYGSSDHSEDNQVTENHGPGIMTGTDMELKQIGSGKGKTKGSITIQTDVTVSKNGGWGVIAPEGDVAVNRVDATGDWGAVGSSTSVISDNGNTSLECYTLNDKGKLVRISSAALESAGAGGIGAGGNMAGALLEVTGNNGPGIVAKNNVNLKQIMVNNNRGPGIQSRKSSITINGTSDNSEENQVMENQGPGIMSGTNMALKPVGSSKNTAKGSVTITTDITVSSNGGWGIIAPEGDVAVNRTDARGTTGKISSSTSIITGNGDTNRKCYVVSENGRLKQISSKSLESAGAGGIGAGANMAGELLEITENNGPGIAAKYDIDLAQIKANNNRGPGIQSLQGTIGVNSGTSDYNEENHVMGNQGPGVMTGTEMNLSTAKFGKNIYFRTHVEVSGNAGCGIFSPLGDVIINGYDYETQGRLSPYTSYVKENGDTSLSCYVVNKKGYLSRLKKYSAGGIACGENMAGYDLEVTDNSGTGIKVLSDLYMDTGKVCNNSEENMSVEGDIVSITDVEVCE